MHPGELLLTNTSSELEVTGKPIPGAGLKGHRRGIHTVTWTLADFRGRIALQGTVDSDAESANWFNLSWPDQLLYRQYPEKTSGTFTETFVGLFTYVRVVVTRAYDPELTKTNSGTVLKVRILY